MSRIVRKPWCRSVGTLANNATVTVGLFDSEGTPLFANHITVFEHLVDPTVNGGVWAVQLEETRSTGSPAYSGDHLDTTVSALEASGLLGGIAKGRGSLHFDLSDSLSVSSIQIVNTTGASAAFLISYGQDKLETPARANQRPDGA